ncbi:hypothetical protein [Ferruginibacter albus]|uniref:hypothetical protein n=1 Tax=Ferruginibacter albus TaxID=2875540 RepID=UPI001CC394B3|nr:hypothetical protein [Ferruginibacter albus]UAY50837.1 hypothetical protein K9M53_09570 [Ferruginibacter albus]
MTWFFLHGNELFILFLTPIAGLIFDFFINKKATFYILGISLFLLLPLLTGYGYTIPYTPQILGLTALSCLYGFYSKQIGKKSIKIISAILFSGLLFIIFGYFAFMNSMSGYQRVENSWTIKNYKIEYIADQGFAGGPLMKYEISKYGLIPIFIKKIDYSVDNDTTNNCLIHFTDIKMDFDKCKITLTERQ